MYSQAKRLFNNATHPAGFRQQVEARDRTRGTDLSGTLFDLCHLVEHPTPNEVDTTGRRLYEALVAAYGWKSDLSDEEILEKVLRLNLERSRGEASV